MRLVVGHVTYAREQCLQKEQSCVCGGKLDHARRSTVAVVNGFVATEDDKSGSPLSSHAVVTIGEDHTD